jgi:hypothetical protein
VTGYFRSGTRGLFDILAPKEGDAMAQKYCPGGLSEESTRRLQAEYATGKVTTPVPCATCGRQVLASNTSGKWVTITHHPPLTVKSGGAKRGSK